MKKIACIFFLTILFVFVVSCETIEIQAPPSNLPIDSDIKPTYTWLVENVFRKHCVYCHSGRPPYLLSYDSVQTVVTPKQPLTSRLYFMIATGRMPKGGKLNEQEKWAIYHWIKNGAKND